MKHSKYERGQALILIVFAIFALVGLTGLTIDGGNVFADRRHAQNAADTAAYAAALAKVRGGDWQSAGLARAADNDYDNNGTRISCRWSAHLSAAPMPATRITSRF